MGFLAPLAAGVSLAGGAAGAYGNIQQGQAEAGAANYNATLAKENAAVSQQNAAISGQAGAAQAGISSIGTRSKVESIEANQAASGVDVNRGSAIDVRSSAAELGKLDALTVRSNAVKEAYGYQVQSEQYKTQSALDSYEAKSDIESSQIGAATTALGGVSGASSNYAKYLQASGGMTGG